MLKGSIYKRTWTYNGKKKRAWGIRYTLNGKLTREIVADTKEGAQAVLERKQEDYRRRLLGVAEGKTLRDLSKPFLEHKRAQERDLPTLEARLKNLLAYFGDTPLEVIGDGIDGYVLARREARVTNATINRELAVLAHMLHLAVRKFRLLRYEPYIEKLQENGNHFEEWSEGEEEALLSEIGQDLRDLIEAAVLTGRRQGQLTGLRAGQVDLDKRVIAFTPSKKGLKNLTPIGEVLYYILARRMSGLSPQDLVFSNGSQSWKRWHIRNRLQVAMKRAGITKQLTFHGLRHTAASRLRRKGADMDDIRKALGQRSKTTTEGYVHYEAEQLRPVLALLESTKTTQDGTIIVGRQSNAL